MMSLGGTQMRVAKLILLVLDGDEEPIRYTHLMQRVLGKRVTEYPFKSALRKLRDSGFVEQSYWRGPYTITERGRTLLRALKERRDLTDLIGLLEHRRSQL